MGVDDRSLGSRTTETGTRHEKEPQTGLVQLVSLHCIGRAQQLAQSDERWDRRGIVCQERAVVLEAKTKRALAREVVDAKQVVDLSE